MVERQLRRRGITDPCVLRAMEEVPRERFLPREARSRAYDDGAVSIDAGQTMSQPWIVACMTTLLGLGADDRVLEIGTGSGYGAAVLSRCAGEVVTVERHAVLAASASRTLAELGYDNVEVLTGDGTLGVPGRGPFDAISVTATATHTPPRALFEQLVPGGVLVCPVLRTDDRELLMRFTADGREEAVVAVRFVPLVTGGAD